MVFKVKSINTVYIAGKEVDGMKRPREVTRLREALEEVSGAYDYCVCDCGRLLDMVVINILIAAGLGMHFTSL